MTDRDPTRRERMLDELTAAMRCLHRRRRRRRRLAGSAALIVLATAVVWGMRPASRTGQERGIADPGPGPVVQVVRRAPRTGVVRTIDDEELLGRLAEIDRPAGLIRTEGRSWLTETVVGGPPV